ncbi:MAG TPA: L,D-transpeptidase family protein [Chthoniobacterales bacterium]
MTPRLLRLALLALPLLGIGCASYDSRLTSTATQYLGANGAIVNGPERKGYAESIAYWDGDGVSGAPSIVIDLSEQTSSFYKGGKLVGVSPISTGRSGYDTPAGSFKILKKENREYRSNLYGDYVDDAGNVVVTNVGIKVDPMPPGTHFSGAPMPYFMRLTNTGVGMHTGFLPGIPDSHGCIRMPDTMARTFSENVSVGTPVSIVP